VMTKFHNSDTVFILAFAIILLNTDLHTPNIKVSFLFSSIVSTSYWVWCFSKDREPLLKEKVDLLVLTSLDQLLLILKNVFNKTRYLYEEVNCTDPSPHPVRVPWLRPTFFVK
jgi:hypothetical protein